MLMETHNNKTTQCNTVSLPSNKYSDQSYGAEIILTDATLMMSGILQYTVTSFTF